MRSIIQTNVKVYSKREIHKIINKRRKNYLRGGGFFCGMNFVKKNQKFNSSLVIQGERPVSQRV